METTPLTEVNYRKVVAGLQDCEERYSALLQSIDDSADSRLAAALKALKNEVRNRAASGSGITDSYRRRAATHWARFCTTISAKNSAR